MYHARVAPQPGAVALHIFGTPAGTCPPGSALSGLGRNSSSGGAGGAVSASSAAAQGALEADGGPFGLSFNGSVIDLSSSFLPG